MATNNPTSEEYVQHHLLNLTLGRTSDGSWKLAESAAEARDMGFMAIHVDTMFFSLLLGAGDVAVFAPHRPPRRPRHPVGRAERHRDDRRVHRQSGGGDLPLQEPARRPSGADPHPVDHTDEPHGSGAGRPDTSDRRARPAAAGHESGADSRPQRHSGHGARRLCADALSTASASKAR